jgi:hypothetical protein
MFLIIVSPGPTKKNACAYFLTTNIASNNLLKINIYGYFDAADAQPGGGGGNL